MFYIYVTIALHDFTEDDSWHSEPVSVRFQSKLEWIQVLTKAKKECLEVSKLTKVKGDT